MNRYYRIYRFFQDDFGNLVRHVTLPERDGGLTFWYAAPVVVDWDDPYFDQWGTSRRKPALAMDPPRGASY